MGHFHVYFCESCNRTIELGGPEEFKIGFLGKKKSVPHVGNKKSNVAGLWVTLWCPQCKKTEKKVIIEFSRPCSSIEVWGRTAPIKSEYQKDDPVRYLCSKCKTMLVDFIEENEICPCTKGIIKDRGFIST